MGPWHPGLGTMPQLYLSTALSPCLNRCTTLISDLTAFLRQAPKTLNSLPLPLPHPDVLSLQDPAHVLPHVFTHSTGTVTNTEINMYFLSSLGSLLSPGLTHSAFEQLEAGYYVLLILGSHPWH